jgi:hypothetical protein
MKLSSTSEVRCQPQEKVALLCIYSGRPGIYQMIGGQIFHDFQLVVLREAKSTTIGFQQNRPLRTTTQRFITVTKQIQINTGKRKEMTGQAV